MGLRRPEREVDLSPTSSVFVAWCLFEQRDNFTCQLEGYVPCREAVREGTRKEVAVAYLKVVVMESRYLGSGQNSN
jgi:hypothetical protein